MIEITGKVQGVGSISGRIVLPEIVTPDIYEGDTVVVPKIAVDQVLQTAMKTVLEDITVTEIPVQTVTNPQGGNTVYIGGVFNYG